MKKTAIGIGLSSFLITLGVSAYQGDPNVQGPNYSAERHEAMTQAFASKDYTAWKNLMSQNSRQGRVMEKVTAENFAKFAEAHDKALAGDAEGAKAIRAELGLGQKNGEGQGRYGKGNGNGQGKGAGQGQGGRGMGYGRGTCVNS